MSVTIVLNAAVAMFCGLNAVAASRNGHMVALLVNCIACAANVACVFWLWEAP